MSKSMIRSALGAAVLAASLPVAAVPTVLNLTASGSSGFVGSAFFQQVPNQSTGTGVIEPFLRLQAIDTEQGFNTSVNGVLDNKDGIWTHPLLLSAVPIVNLSGTNFYQVLLDVNQVNAGDKKFLSLDQLKIYQEATGSISTLAGLTNLRYNLDASDAGNYIKLNYDLNPGSGAGDMFAYIPTSLFSGSNQYFYLYSQFGSNFAANDGFEEWATVGVSAPIPEPSTYALMFAGLAAVGFMTRRRRQT